MLEKVAEVMPHWIEIKVVVGVKYIKMLDEKQDPNLIEYICSEQIEKLKLRRSTRKTATQIEEEKVAQWKQYLKDERIDG